MWTEYGFFHPKRNEIFSQLRKYAVTEIQCMNIDAAVFFLPPRQRESVWAQQMYKTMGRYIRFPGFYYEAMTATNMSQKDALILVQEYIPTVEEKHIEDIVFVEMTITYVENKEGDNPKKYRLWLVMYAFITYVLKRDPDEPLYNDLKWRYKKYSNK